MTQPIPEPAGLGPRFGALAEREFRLLFLGRVVSFFGNAIAIVALAFAVLDLTGSQSKLGLVLAARALPQVVFLLVGGVWADRLPRNLVMVGSNLVSAAAQALVALVLLTGTAELWHLIALQAVGGAASAFFFPASSGAVPQTVSPARLQEANALLRLSINATTIGGAAAGGLLVAGVGPGWTIAIDACTYLLGAALLAPMRLRAAARAVAGSSFLRELIEGWNEFRSRTWLWVIVVEFAFLNAAANTSFAVLGPTVAKRDLGGPAAWGAILTGEAVGLVLGGLLALRIRPARPLLVASGAIVLLAPPFALLGLGAPVAAIAGAAVIGGIGIEIFGVLWDTTMQQQIPAEALARVYSYDALGSFVLMPIGFAVVGPISNVVGISATLYGVAALIVVCVGLILTIGDVRTLGRREAPPTV